MWAEPRDYLLIPLYYLGTFEPHCLRLLPRYLKPRGMMLDVRANIGVFALTAARNGRVISVEAVPPIAAAWTSSLAAPR
jgi:hypothetical protein